ncbi:hypothetical protein HZB60_01170 [candidate division KSB1 bacterium]|nr:hypothetical protein [candidate division KSB1 bacterium]
MRTFLFACSVVVVFATAAFTLLASPVPTTINDMFLPGSQPNQSGTLVDPSQCDNCHGGYDELQAEPAFNWRGSMMAQAMRDPLFVACMTVANQDAPQVGDLCIRCHTPKGWLEGRSVPTDGSALTAADREGVSCDFCHKLVFPTSLGVNPHPANSFYTTDTYPRDQTYLATLATIPPTSANGMYIADSDNARRGPFSDPAARHSFFYSPLHTMSNHCGTCHDVSNPVFTQNASGQYVPNDFNQAAPSFDLRTMFPVERTFSEWSVSAYNTAAGVYAPQFGGNRDTVRTCQDCHMRDVTGHGCRQNDAPLRTNLPKHDMTGGNTVIPRWVAAQYPGEVNLAALDSGIARARYMLQNAASLQVTVDVSTGLPVARVRVTNETGHKLPSGYPEGRRIWINVQAFDTANALVYESCHYDTATAVLTHDANAKIYQIELGISPGLAPVVNQPAGPSFHFVQNDTVYHDNRIPPRGFTLANFTTIQSPPVGHFYAEGQYWDDTDYLLPWNAARVEARLYYQTTSKEYIEFLRDANVTNTSGQTAYDLWAAHGKSTPELMRSATQTIMIPPPEAATVPQPVNDAVDVPVTTLLSWAAGARAASHNVYFGTTSPPPFIGNQLTTTLDPGGDLAPATTYYWRVDELNGGGTTAGTTWSFTTAGELLPPEHLVASSSGADMLLNWSPVPQATEYRIYRVTSADIAPGIGDLRGIVSDTTFTDLDVLNSPMTFHFYQVTAVRP